MSATAKRALDRGDQFPYDAPDSWWNSDKPPPPPKDWVHRAARGVLADLTDRHTIKRAFENVDGRTRKEIVAQIVKIIRLAAREVQP